ncbi:phosphatidate cytidylyltransferase [Hydrogenobacter sp. T-2]|uniref:phosphatidate cytidylyltransferase n=1 Tax=Pampinifervens diazotrophicum TaxID=1632018 RepID=UPI002B2607E3|nr:phosphatidate cytidylyltransferase [Hydrogenobacter sp. T-2]WPM32923.1 phosphatidate cytidylyltransferase [Hydrogenobacter sp. T-2]
MERSFRSRESIGILIGVLTIAVVLSPYPVFYASLLALSLLIGYEVSKALKFEFFHMPPITFLISSISFELGIVSALLLSLYAGRKRWSIDEFFKTLLICVYAGVLPVFLLSLKEDYALLKLLIFVWAVDVFSYYVGKNFGKRPLSPKLSPKKTWEGVAGGGIAGAVVLLALHGFKGFLWSLPLVVVALMGDLFKSFIKRQVGIKDFSNVLGEHGGFTDRFDSLLFTAPVYLFLLKF